MRGVSYIPISEKLFMKALVKKTRSFLCREDGPTVTEYAVMLALIIVVCIAAITLIGDKVKTMFTNLESGLPDGP